MQVFKKRELKVTVDHTEVAAVLAEFADAEQRLNAAGEKFEGLVVRMETVLKQTKEATKELNRAAENAKRATQHSKKW